MLGKSFEKAAELIAVASGKYKTVTTQKRLEGTISNAARATLDSIINGLRREGFQGQRFDQLAKKVASAYRGGNGSNIRIVVDLYLESWQGNEEFYEMKSPLPNKDQCVATTEKLLALRAVKRAASPTVMPHTPWHSTLLVNRAPSIDTRLLRNISIVNLRFL